MPPVRRTFASCIRASASAKFCDHLAVNKVDSWVSNKYKNPGKPCNFKALQPLDTHKAVTSQKPIQRGQKRSSILWVF